MKDKTELTIAIEKLSGQVDCTTCPESRCCCIFKKKYKLPLTKQTAELAFGKKLIPILQEQNRLVEYEDCYLLQNGPCPLLDKNNRCTRHKDREALGLVECIKFPICIENDRHDDLNKIFLDFRCQYVENHWVKIREDAIKIKEQFNIDIVVVFRNHKHTYDQPLSKFDELHKRGLPPQE